MITKTTHGYDLYETDKYNKYHQLYCRDDEEALADIREFLTTRKLPIEVHNKYETFYGVGWGRWLMDGTKDIATAKVTDTWDAWGDCMPYPSTIVLTPIN